MNFISCIKNRYIKYILVYKSFICNFLPNEYLHFLIGKMACALGPRDFFFKMSFILKLVQVNETNKTYWKYIGLCFHCIWTKLKKQAYDWTQNTFSHSRHLRSQSRKSASAIDYIHDSWILFSFSKFISLV